MAGSNTVWVVVAGEYGDCTVDFVAASPEAALAHLKDLTHADRVTWEEAEESTDHCPAWFVVGHFDAHEGSTTPRTTRYEIWPEQFIT